MKKFLIIGVLALVVIGVIISAGCVTENTVEETKTTTPVGITDPSLFTPTGDAEKDKFIGNFVSTDDLQTRITNMSGGRTYIQLFNDGTGVEHDYIYPSGLDYLTSMDITWEVIPEGSPSNIIKILKPANSADEDIDVISVDESEFDLKITYSWASQKFYELYKWDPTQTNVLRNHEGKQFRKMKDTESIPPKED